MSKDIFSDPMVVDGLRFCVHKIGLFIFPCFQTHVVRRVSE